MSNEVIRIRRPPLDTWSVQERLWLAMAVERCGAQNWVSVSRALRPLQQLLQRPSDWYGQRSCAAQYEALLEQCGATAGRKKRSSLSNSGSNSNSNATSQELILQSLTDERIAELHRRMNDDLRVYRRLTDEIAELSSDGTNEARLRQMAAAVQEDQKAKEKEISERAHFIQEREKRKLLHERMWRRPHTTVPLSSPLLTSLLQNPTSSNQPSANADYSTSHSTLGTDKLPDNGPGSPSQSHKVSYELQKIEQIKSELQKIEQNLKEGSISKESTVLSAVLNNPAAVVSTPIKDPSETIKTPEKLDIDDIEIKDEDVYAFSDIDLDIPPVSTIHKPAIDSNLSCEDPVKVDVDTEANESDKCVKDDKRENAPEQTSEIDKNAGNVSKPQDGQRNTRLKTGDVKLEEEDSDSEMEQKVSELKKDLDIKKSIEGVDKVVEITAKELITKVTKENDDTQTTQKIAQSSDSHTETDDDTPIEVIKEDKPGKTKRDYSRKKIEDCPSLSRDLEEIISSKLGLPDELGSDNSQEATDKKPLSRRMKHEQSRSESPVTPVPFDSLPSSPAPGTPPANMSHPMSESDKELRAWKRAMSLPMSRLCALKYSSLFMRPITDDQAPGYSRVVKRPLDFSTIRKNIDNGVTRTIQDFRRDVMLMLTNALMYNRTDHRVHAMTQETAQEVISEFSVLMHIQATSDAETPVNSRLTRPPRPVSRATVKRKRGGDTLVSKKRRTDSS